MSVCGNRPHEAAPEPDIAQPPDKTFSITAERSTRPYSWKIMPIRRRARRSARDPSEVSSTSSSRTFPEVGSTKPVDAADQGALAGPGGADKRHDLTPGHLERNALQSPIAGGVLLDQIVQTKH